MCSCRDRQHNLKEDGCLFHPLAEKDLPAIWERQHLLHALSSEFDAFRLYGWLKLDQTEIMFWRNQFVLRYHAKDYICYTAPYETEDFTLLLERLAELERAAGGKTLNFLNTERPLTAFPDSFIATPRRDLYEYLYRAEDLIFMKGRDYAAKRNQIAQFKRRYDWRFEPLTTANRDACRTVLAVWDSLHPGEMPQHERVAIDRMLTMSEHYGQSGGILWADGQPIAFAIGTHPREQLLDVVVEKALPGYIGAYTMIIQSYAAYAHTLAPFSFINREEDMGLENLRNAKLQLKPERLIEKTLMSRSLE